MDLEELKAENAAAEAAAEENTDETEELETDDSQSTEEGKEESTEEETEESSNEESKEEDDDSWMQGDDGQKPEKKYTGADIGAAKAKVRSKLEARHSSETEALRKEIEELKSKSPQSLDKPKREDFEDSAEGDASHVEAVTNWQVNKVLAGRQADDTSQELARKQSEDKRKTDDAVEKHYERAVVLAEKSGIKPEVYQASDLVVREMINTVFPDAGDVITDTLISRLGEGSEKVIFNLGVNKTRLKELEDRLRNDTSGVSAAMYLGQLSIEINAPRKKVTSAPDPAPNASGETKTVSSKDLKSKYDKAYKKGDMQSVIDARFQAKKEGVDICNW